MLLIWCKNIHNLCWFSSLFLVSFVSFAHLLIFHSSSYLPSTIFPPIFLFWFPLSLFQASLLCSRPPADRQILEWLMVRIKRHRCGQLSSRSLMRAARVSHPALRRSPGTGAADEAVGSAPGNHHTCVEVIRWRLLRAGLITELGDVECDWQWNVDSVIRGAGSWLLFLIVQRCRA